MILSRPFEADGKKDGHSDREREMEKGKGGGRQRQKGNLAELFAL